MAKPTIVLLVELAGGEVVAVPFSDRERADWWEEQGGNPGTRTEGER